MLTTRGQVRGPRRRVTARTWPYKGSAKRVLLKLECGHEVVKVPLHGTEDCVMVIRLAHCPICHPDPYPETPLTGLSRR